MLIIVIRELHRTITRTLDLLGVAMQHILAMEATGKRRHNPRETNNTCATSWESRLNLDLGKANAKV